jgi:putative membrane protein
MEALSSHYLLFKALHIAFMVTWFAGLFYLPRLFIYHADCQDTISHERFLVMERRLFAIMSIGAVLTLLFGMLLLAINPALLDVHWFQVKLVLIVLLFVFHYRCYSWMERLKNPDLVASTRWLRWFNEIPGVILLVVAILAVTKAF